jgi:hypothetical protein
VPRAAHCGRFFGINPFPDRAISYLDPPEEMNMAKFLMVLCAAILGGTFAFAQANNTGGNQTTKEMGSRTSAMYPALERARAQEPTSQQLPGQRAKRQPAKPRNVRARNRERRVRRARIRRILERLAARQNKARQHFAAPVCAARS